MIYLQVLLGLSLLASWSYWIATLIAASRWQSDPSRVTIPDGQDFVVPALTILKPLKGSDPLQRECFLSFFEQQYMPFQLIFGALDPNDLALIIVRALMAEYPKVDCSIVTGGEMLGCNRKVSNFIQMLPQAKHPTLVLCDSDMLVGPDYLWKIGQQFTDPEIGALTCPYRGSSPIGFASKLEALGIGADFIPSTFVGWYLSGMRFGFGSTIAIRNDTLAKIGGFETLVDELADDYLLMNRAAKAGCKVIYSDYMVDDALGEEKFASMFARKLRWAKTSRAMSPGPYLGSFVTHGFVISLLFGVALYSLISSLAVIGATLAFRIFVANFIARKYTNDPNVGQNSLLLPVSDLFSFGLFVLSLCGNTIVWRGERFHLGRGGRLTPVEKKNA
ncbi:MAG: bacteriohopanetetrol glucosamine biosynthesis glycosyltransferase HpnI [Chthonomonadales bacterium]